MGSKPSGSHSNPMNNLALAALGVVYGDIGTSPLYTLRECFAGHHPLALSQSNVFGVLSLIFWALIIVVTLKYVFFIMRADNHGEGGILALLALSRSTGVRSDFVKGVLAMTGIFGASLFYGDAIITPAISVLSAVEGLKWWPRGFITGRFPSQSPSSSGFFPFSIMAQLKLVRCSDR